jgi:hypothetical protein
LPEDGIFTGNADVANHVQHMTAANGITVYHGNHGFGHTANLALYLQNIQARNAVFVDVAALSFYVLVAARTKSFVASAGEHHHINALVFTTNAQGIAHFIYRGWPERIPVALAVNGNFPIPSK